MAVTNPADFLQNAGSTHDAAMMRTSMGAFLDGVTGAGSLKSAGGVHPNLGTQLKVQQAGTPNMTVDVLTGLAFIPGSEAASQGVYTCLCNSTTNLAIAASNPSLPRIDIVVAKVQDSFYSGATDAWSLAVVTGTAAASPAVPAQPANSLVLAQVAVGAGVTSIVNANITDTRTYAYGLGSSGVPAIDARLTVVENRHLFVRRASNSAAKISDTTLADDGVLKHTVAANSTYTGTVFLLPYQSGGTCDIKIAFSFPAGGDIAWGAIAPHNTWVSAANLEVEWATQLATSSPTSSTLYGGAALDFTALQMFWVSLVTSSTSGTLALQWAQGTSSANGLVLKKHSYFELIKRA